MLGELILCRMFYLHNYYFLFDRFKEIICFVRVFQKLKVDNNFIGCNLSFLNNIP